MQGVTAFSNAIFFCSTSPLLYLEIYSVSAEALTFSFLKPASSSTLKPLPSGTFCGAACLVALPMLTFPWLFDLRAKVGPEWMLCRASGWCQGCPGLSPPVPPLAWVAAAGDLPPASRPRTTVLGGSGRLLLYEYSTIVALRPSFRPLSSMLNILSFPKSESLASMPALSDPLMRNYWLEPLKLISLPKARTSVAESCIAPAPLDSSIERESFYLLVSLCCDRPCSRFR